MAGEVITIDSSSDDDSPPPIRAPPTSSTSSNNALAPHGSAGGSNPQQQRPSGTFGPSQGAASSSTNVKAAARPITARKSTGSKNSAPSSRGAGPAAGSKGAPVQLDLSDSDSEEEEEDDLQVANALRPSSKAKKQVISDSSDDDPIAIRPSASPAKARPSSTAAPAKAPTP
ncbi:hypothetical protein BCR35DRAFT_334640, partial [Leucosporidium creatinivorum]